MTCGLVLVPLLVGDRCQVSDMGPLVVLPFLPPPQPPYVVKAQYFEGIVLHWKRFLFAAHL